MNHQLQRILVGTDFSASAGPVLARAAWLARASGAKLEVMHVTTGESNGVANARANLQWAALQLGAKFAVPVRAHVAYGRPHVELAARAAAIGADLLVLGANGERPVRTLFLGSTVQRVQRRSQAPVLIVRNGSLRNYGRVLVGVDFSPASAAAARAVARLLPRAELHFLHVCNVLFEGRLGMAGMSEHSTAGYRNQVLLDASRELDRFLQEQGLNGRRASASVRHGYPPACITEAAAELGASLVALGTKGKTRLEAGLLGSVSEQFVNATSHDVLLARPERTDATAGALAPGEIDTGVTLHAS